MWVSPAKIAELCNTFGPTLKLPSGIDGKKLLWALAGNESAFGSKCLPRHEASYCYGGRYLDSAATAQHGCLAHMSYGPWQLMYPNITKEISPLKFLDWPLDLDLFARTAVDFINRRILEHEHATTVEQIADAFNSGDWRDLRVPAHYIADLVKHYALPVGSVG